MEQRPINVLVNNASVAAPKEDLGRKTVDGLEVRPEPHVLLSCKALSQTMSVQWTDGSDGSIGFRCKSSSFFEEPFMFGNLVQKLHVRISAAYSHGCAGKDQILGASSAILFVAACSWKMSQFHVLSVRTCGYADNYVHQPLWPISPHQALDAECEERSPLQNYLSGSQWRVHGQAGLE